MLAVAGDLPGNQDRWAFEYKWDGVRAICFWDGSQLRLHSRNQLDITRRYPELLALGQMLGERATVLDGEIVALDAAGRPSFERLQHRMHVENAGAVARLVREVPVWYLLFDVLYANGRSTIDLTYQRRREILEQLVRDGPAWQITPSNVGGGNEMLRAATENELEGLVAKRIDSRYEPGRRSPAWIKIKRTHGQEFVIGGWIPEQGTRGERVGSLLMGYYDSQPGAATKLHFVGRVGSGFNAAAQAKLVGLLRSRETPDNPFDARVPRRETRFVRPELIAQVEYRRWPAGGMIQHAAFKGLRDDKLASQVVIERPAGDSR